MRRQILQLISDSAPSMPDDSHTALNCMPKTRSAGNLLFRRVPLSFFFNCACHIRKTTFEKRNLYLLYYLVYHSI